MPPLAPACAGTAEELSGLFLQSCLPYAGQPAALRHWAATARLPELADPARTRFLVGAAGKVFDASNAAGKFVLLSADDGVCAVITEQAGDRETVKGLEDALKGARAMFRMVIERDDKLNPALHHREYLATKGNRAWRILIATKRDGKAGEPPGRAMLTAAPE